jgi:hypothetical protein
MCTVAEEAINSSRKIVTVLNTAAKDPDYDHVAFVQKYFGKNWTGNKMQLSPNGPNLPIMLVLSKVYLVEASDIKKDFLAQPPSSAVHPSFNTLTIQHPGKLGQEAEAKKGVAKLMLLCLQGTVDVSSDSVNNITFALPEPGMTIVMESPCLGRAVALSDLLRQMFIVIRDLDSNDIRSRELSMTHVSKAMASHLLLEKMCFKDEAEKKEKKWY